MQATVHGVTKSQAGLSDFTSLRRVFHLLQIVYSFSMEILKSMNYFTIISIIF